MLDFCGRFPMLPWSNDVLSSRLHCKELECLLKQLNLFQDAKTALFQWENGGENVQVSGSFNDWGEKIVLTKK